MSTYLGVKVELNGDEVTLRFNQSIVALGTDEESDSDHLFSDLVYSTLSIDGNIYIPLDHRSLTFYLPRGNDLEHAIALAVEIVLNNHKDLRTAIVTT